MNEATVLNLIRGSGMTDAEKMRYSAEARAAGGDGQKLQAIHDTVRKSSAKGGPFYQNKGKVSGSTK